MANCTTCAYCVIKGNIYRCKGNNNRPVKPWVNSNCTKYKPKTQEK